MSKQVSIIVPVYNVSAFLDECLESIVSQSFTDWECICVNDGSTDSSLAILQKWAKKDTRIKVYSQSNQGPSAARNFGLSIAQGTYISFVDSDDVVRPKFLQTLVRLMEEDNLDVAGCAYESYDLHITKRFQFATDRILTFAELMVSNQKLQESNDLCFSVRYMIRRKTIIDSKILFDEQCSIGEDTIFNTEVLACSKRIRLTNESLYLYRLNESSIMHLQKYNPRMEESFIRMYDTKVLQIQKYNIDRYTNYSRGLAIATLTQYIPKLTINRKLKGEQSNHYIPAVLDLQMVQNAFRQIGFHNIYPSWREYIVYLAMKFRVMFILKRYF